MGGCIGGTVCVGAVEEAVGRVVCVCGGGGAVGEAGGGGGRGISGIHSCLALLIHSRKCSICYSVTCSSECVAKVVLEVQSSQTLSVSLHPPPQEVQCVHMYSVAGT